MRDDYLEGEQLNYSEKADYQKPVKSSLYIKGSV